MVTADIALPALSSGVSLEDYRQNVSD